MKKVLLTFLALGLISASALQGSENKNSPKPQLDKKFGPNYANACAELAQIGISPNCIIKLTKLNAPENTKIQLSDDGGMVVAVQGNYAINYRVVINTSSSVALFKNDEVISSSALANVTAASPINGMTVVNLNPGDKITIRNIDVTKNVNTLVSTGSMYNCLPVTLFITRL